MPAGSDHEQRRIAALIDDLNCHTEGTDEEAQAELIGMGPVVVDALVERVSELDAGGQLCAIEVFRSLRAERAGAAPLIALLRSDNDVVRSWSAEALGELGIMDATPHLRELLRARKAAGDPPDWIGSVNARWALARLGARQPVVPGDLRAVLTDAGVLEAATRDPDLEMALDALARADQVVAYFQRWRPWNDSWSWIDGASWELDWSAPWPDLVERSHGAALQAAARRTIDPTVVVTIEWLDADDWA